MTRLLRTTLLLAALAPAGPAPAQSIPVTTEIRTEGTVSLWRREQISGTTTVVTSQPDELAPASGFSLQGGPGGGKSLEGVTLLAARSPRSNTAEIRLRSDGGALSTFGIHYHHGTGATPMSFQTIGMRVTFRSAGPQVPGRIVVRWAGARLSASAVLATEVELLGDVFPIPVFQVPANMATQTISLPPLQSAVSVPVVVDGSGLDLIVRFEGGRIPAIAGVQLDMGYTVEFFPDVVASGGCTVIRRSDSCLPAGQVFARFNPPGSRTLEAPVFRGPPRAFALTVISAQSMTTPLDALLPAYAPGCVALAGNPVVAIHPTLSATGDALNTVTIPLSFSGTLQAQVLTIDDTGRFGTSNTLLVQCP